MYMNVPPVFNMFILHPCSKRFLKEEFQGLLDQLKGTLTQLGQTFSETFKQVGQTAAQQGGDLLNQALQQGALLAANGAQSEFNRMNYVIALLL